MHAILTPLLMVLIMITGDFLGMSMTTDNVRPSPIPNAWRVSTLTVAFVFMGVCELVLCSGVLAVGSFRMHLALPGLRTLAFVTIVFGNQATTYLNRARERLWSVAPSRWVVAASVADLLVASTMAGCGLGMARLPWYVLGEALACAVAFAFAVDFVRVPVFRRLAIV